MPRARKNIYCERCNNTAHWYKRGRKSRVLVCDGNCGVIAHNPVPKAPHIWGLKKAGEYVGLLDKEDNSKGGGGSSGRQHIVTDSKDRPNYSERVINQVMRSEGL